MSHRGLSDGGKDEGLTAGKTNGGCPTWRRARGGGWEAPRLGGPGLAAGPAGLGPRAVDHLGRPAGSGTDCESSWPTRDAGLAGYPASMTSRSRKERGDNSLRLDTSALCRGGSTMREDGGIMAATST